MIDNLSETELYERVKAVLQKVMYKSASLEKLSPGSRLDEDLDIDSARLVDLILNLEDEFKIRIEDEVFEQIKTFGDLVAVINKKSAEADR